MSNELILLAGTAATVGFLHTIFGPDHYLPFIVMARANRWSSLKTVWVTLLCGIGHVGSSVLLGAVGIAAGVAVSKLEALESFRGDIAAWVLIGFGLAYFIWGLRRALLDRPHEHAHVHEGGITHTHRHVHTEEHAHVHGEGRKNLTPWVLFVIFVLGPCEPLIPILMYPAAKKSLFGIVLVALIFGLVTVATMLSVVVAGLKGVNRLPMASLERYAHALAGAAIFLSGIGIRFLGL